METDLSGSSPVKRTTVRSARLRVLREKPGEGEGEPISSGCSPARSEDSLGDFRDTGGKPGSGELGSTGQGLVQEPG